MQPSLSDLERNDKVSIIQLVRGICHDTLTLSSKELTAAKLEIKQEITKGLKAGISLSIGGFILSVGVILRERAGGRSLVISPPRTTLREETVAVGDKISQLEQKIQTTKNTTLNPPYHVRTRPWATLGICKTSRIRE